MDTTVDKINPYTRRPWIITALSLRFNDALTYREIAEQLNISTSATHKMFKRFRRTGLTGHSRQQQICCFSSQQHRNRGAIRTHYIVE